METAGGPPAAAPRPVERNWPRLDTPNVLWFFGAFATAIATLAVIDKVPESSRDVWELIVAIAFYLAYSAAGFVLVLSLIAFEHVFGFVGLFLSFPSLYVAGKIRQEFMAEDAQPPLAPSVSAKG